MNGLSTLLSRLLVSFFLPLFFVSATAQNLRLYHIDVEQGDATLFVSPGGKTLLVDAGPDRQGRRIVSAMNRAGVTKIDFFVNTHYHADHYGGIDELPNEFNISVGQVYDRGDTCCLKPGKKNEPTYRAYRQSVGQQSKHLQRGEPIPFDPKVTVTCIASGGVVLGETDTVPGVDENDMSVSLLIQYGKFRYFVGGDIEITTEAKIADLDAVTDVDVYQANHHGSHTSSSPSFMEDLKPSVIVISNGNRADYMHPRKKTLDFYASMQPPPIVIQTNKYSKGGLGGNVPDAFIADLKSTDSTGTVLLDVNASTGTYTVSYHDTTFTVSIKGGATSTSTVVIESLLPDPVGNDAQLEEVTLKNKGTTSVLMQGWVLQDKSGRVWSLSSLGTLSAGQSKTIRRTGMPMNLNNNGDEIFLYDETREERDRFSYPFAVEGERIVTGH